MDLTDDQQEKISFSTIVDFILVAYEFFQRRSSKQKPASHSQSFQATDTGGVPIKNLNFIYVKTCETRKRSSK
jgi:hypothetical protein